MKAICCERPGSIRLQVRPDPEPPPGWARVRVKAAGICTTDFEVIAGGIDADYPVIPGHEWSGVVDRAGNAADEAWIGQRVTGDNEVGCLECAFCRGGEWRRCAQYRQIGFGLPGGYAECLLVPVRNLHRIEDSVSFEQGCILEPLGVGLAVARLADARIGSTAAVLGAGPIGLNCLAALRASGCVRILCLDRRPERLELARSWGAWQVFDSSETLEAGAGRGHPAGTDIVVEAAGSPELLGLATRLVRFGGRLLLAGYFRKADVPLKPDLVHERNVTVIGAGNNTGYTGAAAAAASAGLLRTEGMITHRFAVEEYASALTPGSAERPGYIKGVFVF